MTLRYLDFDYSEDSDGTGTWDAMASVLAPQLPALLAEVAQVLDWAHAAFAGQLGPIEDGADWDYDLQAVHEVATTQHPRYDEATRQIALLPDAAGTGRYTLTLSLSGTPAFGAALREQFGLA
ncbi:hypothetical protein [Stenotrophomonas sp. YIM B06876]|uniref:hypothetical protein n=1 Tax=Stenotrophomonas sp. YIM B06876 TaxID=3060211 RepID=UPI002739DEC1|nr:hypothetical protein [Stenotrophomonas sp. YIM B06876]